MIPKNLKCLSRPSVQQLRASYGSSQCMDEEAYQNLRDLANIIRIHSIVSTEASKSGHPTTCSSCAEILSVLFFNIMRYKVCTPNDPSSDRFILSKGHAAPALYAAWAEAGLVKREDLLNLRKIGSDLEGHPTPRLNFIDVATGSLGQGLGIACGMAYCGKYIDETPYRVYCLLGDGEAAEGAVWEAAQFASYYKLNNLCAIFDINRLGQTRETLLGHRIGTYQKRLAAFGFNAVVVDGHDVEELVQEFRDAAQVKCKPTAIIAKTYKGKSFPGVEDKNGWHGKPLGKKAKDALDCLHGQLKGEKICVSVPLPCGKAPKVSLCNIKLNSPPCYNIGDAYATREIYGVALAKLCQSNNRVIALDGETSNSTFSEKVRQISPKNYVECFICEQNLVGVAVGLQCRDRCVTFSSTFGAFWTRAFDNIRMAAISQANINLCGSHCGVSIGEDGPSQMALEDLAMFRTIPGCTIFYPADAVSTERAVELAANTKGICFIRTNRPKTKVIYCKDTVFEIGRAQIIKQSNKDNLLVIAAGITLEESLQAYEELKKKCVRIRIMDPFTIKPIDKAGILCNAKQCRNRILVVEDHYYEGGIGEAVMQAVSANRDIVVKHMAVSKVPRSGPMKALLRKYRIDACSIADTARQFIKCTDICG